MQCNAKAPVVSWIRFIGYLIRNMDMHDQALHEFTQKVAMRSRSR